MKRKMEINKSLYHIGILLFIAVVISTYFVMGIYAKYTSKSTSSEEARVAAYIFNVSEKTGNYFIDLENIKKPGDFATYEFTITNDNGSTISEVTQEYFISISQKGTIPLTTKLTRVSDSQDVINLSNMIDEGNTSGIIKASESKTITYILTVTWDSAYNSYLYGQDGNFSKIEIEIKSEQKD